MKTRTAKLISVTAVTSISGVVIAATLAAAPLAVRAAADVYDFTGVVTKADGEYASIAVGTPVSGTYTINIANANPAQAEGPFASPTGIWIVQNYGGSEYGTPSPTKFVFSSTAKVAGYSYATAAPGAYASLSDVEGSVDAEFIAAEVQMPRPSAYTDSNFSVTTYPVGSSPAYTAQGLPNFSAAASGTGQFIVVSGATFSSVTYRLSTLTLRSTCVRPLGAPLATPGLLAAPLAIRIC